MIYPVRGIFGLVGQAFQPAGQKKPSHDRLESLSHEDVNILSAWK